MNEDRIAEPKKKKDANRLMTIISVMLVAVLVIADFYIMINNPRNYPALAGITLLLLVWVYLFTSSMIREIHKAAQLQQEPTDTQEEKQMEKWQQSQIQYFSELIKSEKASYLLLKKVFEQMSKIQSGPTLPNDDIIGAQKAIAKVTINRSKENTDAILNSNDKVMERMFMFEEKIDENNQQLLEDQREVLDASARGMLEGQQMLSAGINELENSIQNELFKISGAIESLYEKMVTYTSETTEEVMKLREEMKSYLDSEKRTERDIPKAEQMSVLEQIEMPEDELGIGELAFQDEETVIGEMAIADEFFLDEEVSNLVLFDDEFAPEGSELEDLPLLNDEQMSEEDLEGLDFLNEESELEDLPLLEDEPELNDLFIPEDALEEEELFTEEDILQEEELFTEEVDIEEEELLAEEVDIEEEELLAEEDILQEEVQETTVVSDIDLSNPNKMLTPEEIEALVAGAGESNTEFKEEEPEEEPEPEELEQEKLGEENKPTMPDLSNPNKLMTPDEIAALIANM